MKIFRKFLNEKLPTINLFSGLGTYKHSSGYYYEGLFSNGIPNKLETASLVLSIDGESLDDDKLRIFEGNPLSKITVKCVNDENEILIEDGRLIQLVLAAKIDITDNTVYENQIQTEL